MTTIRYDFWSLVAALAEGLGHDGTPVTERAQGIADALSKQPLAIRSKREEDLAVVLEHLVAIQQKVTVSDTKTAEWPKSP
jgi:hypothetical protein